MKNVHVGNLGFIYLFIAFFLFPSIVTAQTYTEDEAYEKMTGDFNGDGITDLIWMHSGGEGLYAYTALGRGDGSFDPASGGQLSNSPVLRSSRYGMFKKLLGDFNGDGYTDLSWVHSSGQGLYVYTSTARGDGSFNSAVGSALSYLNFGSNGTVYTPTGYEVYDKVTGDFNGDGMTDLAWMYFAQDGARAYTALARGDGGFHPASGRQLSTIDYFPHGYLGSYAGDLNEDSITDLVWLAYGGYDSMVAFSAIAKGNADGEFHSVARIEEPYFLAAGYTQYPTSYYKPMIADFNGDNILDFAWSHSGSEGIFTTASLGHGDGRYVTLATAGQQLSNLNFGQDNAYADICGDFNGDGIIDLAWVYSGQSGLYAYTALGHGDGTFIQAVGGSLLYGNFGDYKDYTKLAKDLNGDGIADLVWMHAGDNGLYAYTSLGLGNGNFSSASGGQLLDSIVIAEQ